MTRDEAKHLVMMVSAAYPNWKPLNLTETVDTWAVMLEEFDHDEKLQLVDVLNQEVQIDGRKQYVNNAIKIYCRSVLDALNEDDSSLIQVYEIEL